MAREAIALIALIVLCACQKGGAHGEPSRRDISRFAGDAQKVAIGDLDGDGKPELVFADGARLWVTEPDGTPVAETPAPGGIDVLTVDGGAILAGWGWSREHGDARPRIDRYTIGATGLADETVLAPESERAEIVAILPAPPGLFVAWYASKYMVTSAIATRGAGGWSVAPIATIRMATSYARGDVDGDGTPDLVVGRMYGDDQDTPGDAFVLAPDGTRRAISTVRGVRGLAIAPDGAIWLGDGWDKDYGRVARGRLSVARGGDTELVEDVAGEYTIDTIRIADVDGDGAPEVIAKGSAAVRVYRKDGGWTGATIAGKVRDVAVGDLDGVAGAEVVTVGAPSEVITWQRR